MTHPPNPAATADGYVYYRCRAGDDDSTVYVHQLCAVAAGYDPDVIWSDDWDVHHRVPIPWLNFPVNVELREAEDHRTRSLEGEIEHHEPDAVFDPDIVTPDGGFEDATPGVEGGEEVLQHGD